MKEWICQEEPLIRADGASVGVGFRQMVELVRCKDCKHGNLYMTEDVCGKTLIECNHPALGDTIAIHAWDWFCADGERK